MALDADEFLSNYNTESPEWKTILSSPPGTVIRFKWVHLSPDLKRGVYSTFRFPWGYVDDGLEHTGRSIHSPRIPVPEFGRNIEVNNIVVIHYGFVIPERNNSKKNWYKLWEFINNNRTATQVNRAYNEVNMFDSSIKIPKKWINQYIENGIDMTSFNKMIVNISSNKNNEIKWTMIETYWWDKEVLKLIDKHSSRKFKKINIWNTNWAELSAFYGYKNKKKFAEPRNIIDKIISKLNQLIYK